MVISGQNERKTKRTGMKNQSIQFWIDRFVFDRSSSMKSPMFYPPPPPAFSSQPMPPTSKSPHVKSWSEFDRVEFRNSFLFRTNVFPLISQQINNNVINPIVSTLIIYRNHLVMNHKSFLVEYPRLFIIRNLLILPFLDNFFNPISPVHSHWNSINHRHVLQLYLLHPISIFLLGRILWIHHVPIHTLKIRLMFSKS